MSLKFDENLNVLSGSDDLEIELLDGDLNIIAKLDDEPNDVGGLTSAELKAKFDEAGNTIQKYINETLIPAVIAEDATEAAREAAEQGRVTAEEGRVTAEQGRVEAESARASAETARASAETSRAAAEQTRASAETQRETNESTRVSNEQGRVEAESARQKSETARQAAESVRVSAETERVQNERVRQSKEAQRRHDENARAEAEKARAAAETERKAFNTQVEADEAARVTAEKGRVSAETARASAETGRAAAEQTRASAETQREANESTRVSNEQGRVEAEQARQLGEKTRWMQEDDRQFVFSQMQDTIGQASIAMQEFAVWETYDNTKTYSPFNKVAYNGSSYLCIAETTGNAPPNEDYWQLIAAKGKDGEGGDMFKADYDPTHFILLYGGIMNYVEDTAILRSPQKGAEQTLNGPLNMKGNKISNIATPEDDGDAVPKSYVDGQKPTLYFELMLDGSTWDGDDAKTLTFSHSCR